MKQFKSKGKKGFCYWCGDKLKKEHSEAERVGYRGLETFCSLRCGFNYGVLTIRQGDIYQMKKEIKKVVAGK